MSKAIRCHIDCDICPICEMCQKHCVGHVLMRTPVVLVKGVACKALLNWKKTKGGDKTLTQVGRVDTAITQEAEQDAVKASKKRTAA